MRVKFGSRTVILVLGAKHACGRGSWRRRDAKCNSVQFWIVVDLAQYMVRSNRQ